MREAYVQCPAVSYKSTFIGNCASELRSWCRRDTHNLGPLPGHEKACAYACSIADQMVQVLGEEEDR